jgi:hypothetical protein
LLKSAAPKVKRELKKHGATSEQAQTYVDLVRQFERESNGMGELHHLLPGNCGWWRKYRNLRKHPWNGVRVDLGLHASLHGYLYFVFPKNKSLHEAIRAVFITRRLAYKKSLQDKQKIIDWYLSGRSAQWISKQKLPGEPGWQSVYNWLKEWGVKMRSNGESNAHPKKERFKQQIIAWYSEGRTAVWITKRIGLTGSANSVLSWLKTWGIKTRTAAEARERSYRFKHRRKFKKSIYLYLSGLSIERVAKKLALDPKTIKNFVVSEGIKIRPHSEYVTSSQKKNFKSRVIKWYRRGETMTMIEKKVGISRGAIRKWLIEWGIKIRPRATRYPLKKAA